MKLIVGLGNPGTKYADTRHNVGFRVIDDLEDKLNCQVTKEKNKALIGEARYKDEKIILVKPQTFMNLSGESVLPLASWYKISPEDIIVAYDDMALDVGRLRLRKKGSHGGHNGMRSIISLLQTDEFPRVRVGIGKPNIQVVDYVLGRFSKEDDELIAKATEQAAKAILFLIDHGMDKAMSRYNG